MTIYLCISFVVIALLVVAGKTKAAVVAALAAIAAGFGYRLYAGEEISAVAGDALFCAALLPIGFWMARQGHGLIDAPQAAEKN